MKAPEIVIDTNVLVAALRSKRGASHRVITLIGQGSFEISISVPLVLEYEAAALRCVSSSDIGKEDVGAVIDYICKIGHRRRIHYLWRPVLSDPKDEMVLEVAVAGGCESILTYNKSDFAGAEKFGIRLHTPKEFLRKIGELK